VFICGFNSFPWCLSCLSRALFLNPKLPQMMVNVLVLAYAPFITLERSEKAMHIPVRASRAFGVKVRHQCFEPRASGFEIRFVSDN